MTEIDLITGGESHFGSTDVAIVTVERKVAEMAEK